MISREIILSLIGLTRPS